MLPASIGTAIAAIGVGATGVWFALKSRVVPRPSTPPPVVTAPTVHPKSPGVRLPVVPKREDVRMATVTLPNGDVYEVAAEYIGPVKIGEAESIARSMGLDLPSSELVDAIFKQADLRFLPMVRAHDGTPKTMSSAATYEKQAQRIVEAIGGRSYTLLAGTHKDVVRLPSGKPGLYGWNVADDQLDAFKKTAGGIPTHSVRGASGVKVMAGAGRVVQQEFGGHGLDWGDYSQGLRLVRKVNRVG